MNDEPYTLAVVRPKILRRPAQFSGEIPAGKVLTALRLAAPMPIVAATPASKPWQDDGRFAVALLTIIILMNVLVTLWLAHITRQQTSNTTPAPHHTVTSGSVHVLDDLAHPVDG